MGCTALSRILKANSHTSPRRLQINTHRYGVHVRMLGSFYTAWYFCDIIKVWLIMSCHQEPAIYPIIAKTTIIAHQPRMHGQILKFCRQVNVPRHRWDAIPRGLGSGWQKWRHTIHGTMGAFFRARPVFLHSCAAVLFRSFSFAQGVVSPRTHLVKRRYYNKRLGLEDGCLVYLCRTAHFFLKGGGWWWGGTFGVGKMTAISILMRMKNSSGESCYFKDDSGRFSS